MDSRLSLQYLLYSRSHSCYSSIFVKKFEWSVLLNHRCLEGFYTVSFTEFFSYISTCFPNRQLGKHIAMSITTSGRKWNRWRLHRDLIICNGYESTAPMEHAVLFVSAVGGKVNLPCGRNFNCAASFPSRETPFSSSKFCHLRHLHFLSRRSFFNHLPPFQRDRATSTSIVRCRSNGGSQQQRRPGRTSARQEKSAAQLMRDAQTVYTRQKPPWCQPWSIVSTGAAIIAAAWKLVGVGYFSVVAVFVTFAILLWWYVFLVLYPQQELQGDDS